MKQGKAWAKNDAMLDAFFAIFGMKRMEKGPAADWREDDEDSSFIPKRPQRIPKRKRQKKFKEKR